MFWVVTEICSEHNLIRRSKMIKQFIKVARMYTKEIELNIELYFSNLTFIY